MKIEIKTGVLIIPCLLFLMLAGCNGQADFYVEAQEHESGLEENTSGQPEDIETSGQTEASQQPGSAEQKEKPEEADAPEESGASQPDSLIYVQICGAVVSPGVYALPEGSRIFAAIEQAGGMLPEAELSSVNQAQTLSDGQMVYVYCIGEEGMPKSGAGASDMQTGSTAEQDKRVNINTASAEELMTLPGIGQAKADSIISYRETHGAFKAPEDIKNIEGVKEGVYSKIKDQIKID